MTTISKIRMFLSLVGAVFFLAIPLGLFLNKEITATAYALTNIVGFIFSWALTWPVAKAIDKTFLKITPPKEDEAWQYAFTSLFISILIVDLYAVFVLPFAHP